MEIKQSGKTVEGYPIYEIRTEEGYCNFAVGEDEIVIYAIISKKRGFMKKVMSNIVKKFGINKITFWVPSVDLLLKLRNIVNIKGVEEVELVTVEWKV
ncbi:MAG: hypothetical protein J7J51_05225 [Candidatus Omnitrophica bacterium]|nr:hypothetical protein [Candidatus Omnitrophota bacterium]